MVSSWQHGSVRGDGLSGRRCCRSTAFHGQCRHSGRRHTHHHVGEESQKPRDMIGSRRMLSGSPRCSRHSAIRSLCAVLNRSSPTCSNAASDELGVGLPIRGGCSWRSRSAAGRRRSPPSSSAHRCGVRPARTPCRRGCTRGASSRCGLPRVMRSMNSRRRRHTPLRSVISDGGIRIVTVLHLWQHRANRLGATQVREVLLLDVDVVDGHRGSPATRCLALVPRVPARAAGSRAVGPRH